jgi:3-oxoacyl-[acyl-carrier protein] reductase
MLLANKTAVITGCSRGIGKKTLEIFSENGATVFACVRNLNSDFKILIKKIEKKTNNEIIPVELNLEKSDSVKIAANFILKYKKPIDILINNAGIIYTSFFLMTPVKKIKEIFEVNFFSQSEFTQYIAKSMIKNKKGSILYISSTSGLDNNIGRSAYSSSKAAMISQSMSLAGELGAFNIRVNSIAPGLTDTDMMRLNTSKEIINEVLQGTALKRIAKPEEIANVALFLSSDLASYITGQVIRVDGGI